MLLLPAYRPRTGPASMPIITLTTDYGLRDPYAGQLKGSLLCACPSAQLVDITHDITPFDLIEAAYFLTHTLGHYPAGTIHICTVNSLGEEETPFICFRQNEQYFILPDNGLASLLWPELDVAMVRLGVADELSNKRALAKAVSQLTLGYEPARLGEVITDAVTAMQPAPVTTPNFIRGSIVHIDRYHNAILNVHRDLVVRMAKGRAVHTRFSNSDPIVGIVDHYHEAPEGELLARYNSRGYVELAINMGRAAQLFGLQRDQLVQLEFLG